MPTITLPQATKDMKTGTIRRWRKSAGDPVRQGEVLVEVETDDGVVEIEAGQQGQLSQILASEGATIAVHAPLAVINANGAPAPAPAPAQPAKGNGEAVVAPNPGGPVIPIVMPKAGQSMEEGALVKWRVGIGDVIQTGQVIFEIETDKATMDVEATDAGRIARIVLPEGGACKVLEPVAYLAASDADVDAYLAGEGQVRSSSFSLPSEDKLKLELPRTPSPGTPGESKAEGLAGGRTKASPAARKIASERGVDLATLTAGSGPGGRILSMDVPLAAKAPAPPTAPKTPAPAAAPAGATRKRMSPMRKAIARNLLASKQTIPHFYLKLTINADPLYAFYQAEKAKYPCSLNDVIVMASAKSVMEFPAFRCRIDGDEFVERSNANIGIAVGMDEGLVVPVLLNAEMLTLKQIGSESKRIATAARSGKIEGMGQGVFTITNLGMFGVEEFIGIINPPEAAILAVGAIREEVIVSGGTLRPGRVMTMTLSADHRVVDGMLAAKFMARMKEILEYPQQLTA